MRTSELERFQTYRRRGGHRLSRSNHAVYQRRLYWRRKLVAAGVPEADLDEMVERVLHLRMQQRVRWGIRDKLRESNREWRESHPDYFKDYMRKRYEREQREDRARMAFAIGGMK